MFSNPISSLVGGGIDKLAGAVGLEEIAPFAKIAAGYFMGDPSLMMDGAKEAIPQVLDFANQALDLGGAEPGKPKGSKGSKKDQLNLLQGLLGGAGGGGGGDLFGKGLSAALG